MSLTRPGVLLDVDGTLVDSNYLHAVAWSRGFIDLGEWAPMHAIHRLIGMGGDQLVSELLGGPRDGASDAWRRRYDELLPDVRTFPGAADLVRRLLDLDLVVVAATSSPADLLGWYLELAGVTDLIEHVVTADDVEVAKPAPDVFRTAMERGSIDPARAIAIGDSIWDVRAARAAGIACIGLETGGFSRHELSEDGAIAVYRDPAELAAQLLTSPVGLLVDARLGRKNGSSSSG
jgi:HAD superfamily hydrolase (TIGR01549 family)